ncbi:MAG: hypothetical protein BWK80_52385 [Desulfobacteraceae bacterium IS3]|nr:MAG: hypothetical protein BWK80_52385 [Desulfobacteraceae bacterium IS3]
MIFTHESGIHCHAMLKVLLAYQPFSAEMIGRKSRFVIGKHSGAAPLSKLKFIPDFSTPSDKSPG